MRVRPNHIHVLVLVGWIAAVAYLLVDTALLNADALSLRREFGSNRDSRLEAAYKLEHLRNDLRWEASEANLVSAIRRLGLHLRAPHEPLAGRGGGAREVVARNP